MSNTTRLKAKRTIWREEHDNVLKERFHTDYIHEIASHLCCAKSTVSRHARLLGLRKENRSGRNHDARVLVEMEYQNLSYGEMAERTGLCENTIYLIARELGLSRTPEQKRAIKSRLRKELIRSERRRAVFGLEPRTNIKVGSDIRKIRLRGHLKRHGYIVDDDGTTFYYYAGLCRHPIREEHGRKLGFKFMPLPTSCAEETEKDSASPAVSANGQTIN